MRSSLSDDIGLNCDIDEVDVWGALAAALAAAAATIDPKIAVDDDENASSSPLV